MIEVVESARRNLTKSAPTHERFLDELERQGLAGFVARLKGATPEP